MRRCLLISLAAAALGRTNTATRGFLLAATRAPVEALAVGGPGDELGALLRDICATGYPARVAVANKTEYNIVRSRRPCARVEPWTLPASEPKRGETAGHLDVRFHKVTSIAANAAVFPDGTLYVDNDISIKRGAANTLFRVFDDMSQKGKAVGFSHDCTARGRESHRLEGVPSSFCERNGGVAFLGPGAAAIAREWLLELRRHPGPGGTDQKPLRQVLWRRRGDLFDLPDTVQCRCKHYDGRKPSICDTGAALWHLHRRDRLAVAARLNASVSGALELCGFFP